MYNRLIHWLVLVISTLILIPSVLGIMEDRYVYVIDPFKGVTFEDQTALTVSTPDMYIPENEFELSVPSTVSPSFYEYTEQWGRKGISPRLLRVEDGYNIYSIQTRNVNYGSPYVMGYSVKIDRPVTQYIKNFHFEDYLELISDSKKVVYVCTPSDSLPAKEYDSRPESYYSIGSPYTITLPTIKPIEKIPMISYGMGTAPACPNGFKEHKITVKKGVLSLITYDFSMPSANDELVTISEGRIKATGPERYKDKIETNIKKIASVMPTIESYFKNIPLYEYRVHFVSDNDDVLNGGSIISYQEGDSYIGTSIVQDDDQLFQVNVLRAIIGSATLNTYSQERNNWWTGGAESIMAFQAMKKGGLQYQEIQDILDETKSEITKLTSEELTELRNSDLPEAVATTAAIVNEIEAICPGHIPKLNEITQSLTGVDFATDRTFDNYLIYHLNNVCGVDVTPVLDKFRFEHDGVISTSLRLSKVKAGAYVLKKVDPAAAQIAQEQIGYAEEAMELGKVTAAVKPIETAESAFGQTLERMDLSKLISDLKTNFYAIPPDFATQDVTEGISILNSADTQDTINKLNAISTAIGLYEKVNTKYGGLIEEYVTTKKNVDSVNPIFTIPGKLLANSNLNKAESAIKEGDFELAKEKLTQANFNTKYSTVFTIIILVLLLACSYSVYKKVHTKEHKAEHHKEKQ